MTQPEVKDKVDKIANRLDELRDIKKKAKADYIKIESEANEEMKPLYKKIAIIRVNCNHVYPESINDGMHKGTCINCGENDY